MQDGGVCVFHGESKCRFEQDHKEIWDKIGLIETAMNAKLADLDTRMTAIGTQQAVSDEQIKVVFKILNEIKESLTKLTDQTIASGKERLTRLSVMLYSVGGTVLSALILGGMAYLAIKGGR